MSATIHERIAELVKRYGKGKNTLFASLIGTTEGSIRGYVKGIQPKHDILESIVRNCDSISPRWLLTGEGPMLEKDTSRTQEATQTKPKATRSTPTSEATESVLLSLIREKDETIRQQAIEIGKLTEQLRSLKSQD